MDTNRQKILAVFSAQPITTSFATITESGIPWVRYVMVIIDNDDLTLRFSTFTDSRKVAHIIKHPEVHLTCGCTDPSKLPLTYLQIQGIASCTTDMADKKLVWHKHLEAYFRCFDDPNFSVIKVMPYRIEICSHDAKTTFWGNRDQVRR